MASSQAVETSVANNIPSQDSSDTDDHFQSRYLMRSYTKWVIHQSCSHGLLLLVCFFFFTVRIMRFSWGEIDQESQLEQIVEKAGTEIGWGKTNLFIIMGET